MEITNPCKICTQKESKYMCPRCNIPYCSLPCYQSQTHVQCSESFYKECVVEQIKNDELDPESQKRMMEILQRVQQVDDHFENEEEADSDDDDSEDELANRLAGVDLDDADEVWDRLTEEERRQFEELLRSGDVSEVIPQWQPWWLHRETLVVEVAESSSHEEESDLSSCPTIKEDIQPLSKLSKITPSPAVRWNVVNVLAAYAVTARVYNGEYHSSALEAAMMLGNLSSNLTTNQVFESPELAVASVQLAAVNGDCLVEGLDQNQLKEDVQSLVKGPSEAKHSHSVLAALSDVHSLLTTAKRQAKENVHTKSGRGFSKRFPNSSAPTTSASELNKYLKKIEFYLSWTKESF